MYSNSSIKSILFLLITLPFIALAQGGKEVLTKHEHYITADLFSPFYSHYDTENNTPRYRVGYIRNITAKSKIGLNVGYGDAATALINTGSNYALWEIRPAYYHIFNPRKKTLHYFSVALFYINHQEVFANQSFFNTQNDYLVFDRADYTRQKLGIIPKVGMFINLGNRLGLDTYTGLGLRYRINTYSNFTNLESRVYDEEHTPPYYRNEGNLFGLEFTIGLKLYLKYAD